MKSDKISLGLILFALEYSTYDHQRQHFQPVSLRSFSCGVSLSYVLQSALSLSPGIQQLKYC